MGDVRLESLSTAAFNAQSMPDGLTCAEQLLFLSLRAIYREYRAGTTTMDQAKREKAEAMRAYRDNDSRERLWQDAIDRIQRSEEVRREIERDGCPLCRRLTRVIDGRE